MRFLLQACDVALTTPRRGRLAPAGETPALPGQNTSHGAPVHHLSMSIDLSISKPVRRVGMISLGCPKNLVDSEIMLGQLREESEVEITNDLEAADVVIVNTCGFID